MGLVVNTLWMC